MNRMSTTEKLIQMSIAIAEALIACAGIESTAAWQGAIATPEERASYFGCIENGSRFKALEGDAGVGTHGGSEDHTAILASRVDRVSAFSYVPVRPAGDCALPEGWRFVVMASGIEADKAGSAKARYNRASLATQALLGEVRGEPAVDREALADVLLALSATAEADASIVAADLNPLIVVDGRPVPVDALVEVAG